jgi:uncharacterized delta-60 repeat protein
MKTRAFLLMSLIYLAAFSQDGSPDLSFGNNGIVEHDLNGGEETLYDSDQGISGRIVAVGTNYDPNSNITKNFIAAFNEDGSLDTSFNQTGFLLSDMLNSGTFQYVEVQDDNKVLVANDSGSDYKIFRFLEDGAQDASFATNGVLSPFVSGETGHDFYLGPNGNIFVLGRSSSTSIVLKKFLPNGTLDPSFGSNGVTTFEITNASSIYVYHLWLLENGSVIVSCSITENGFSSGNVVRFQSNGAIDTSYGIDGIALIPIDEEFSCRTLPFPDGSVLANCSYYDWLTDTRVKRLVKLRPNGSLDTSFAPGGYIAGYYGSLIQPNERIITDDSVSDFEGGSILNYSRLYSNGSFDPSFLFSTNYFDSLANTSPILLNSGKMLVASSDIWYNAPDIDIILQRFNNNPLGIEDFDSDKINVFPNPSNGLFTLNLSNSFISEIAYQITDVTGKIIQTGDLKDIQSVIDISEAKSGMYFFITGNSKLRLIKK